MIEVTSHVEIRWHRAYVQIPDGTYWEKRYFEILAENKGAEDDTWEDFLDEFAESDLFTDSVLESAFDYFDTSDMDMKHDLAERITEFQAQLECEGQMSLG